MLSQNYDAIIVGGGISGFSMAHYLSNSGKKVLILEKENEPGGCVNTPYFSNEQFWLEMGAHTCYNSYKHLCDIVKSRGLLNQVIPQEKLRYAILKEGKEKSIFSELSLAGLMFNMPKAFFKSKEGLTVKEYYQSLMGEKNYENVGKLMFNAVISQKADAFPAEIFLKMRKERDADFPKKFTFKKGLGQVFEQIMLDDNVNVAFQAEVSQIRFENNIYRLDVNGKEVKTENLALATSAKVASELLKSVKPTISSRLDKIPSKQVKSIGLVVKKSKVEHLKPLAVLLPVGDIFYSLVSRDTVPHDTLRAFTFHLKDSEVPVIQALERAMHILGVRKEDVVDVKNKTHELGTLHLDSLTATQELDELLPSVPGLYLVGNYFLGLSLEDCVERASRESERLLK
ncbi:protoporphyrinogen/coproporphyrinogen oxidase [Aureibacter tunicatorum]|uniref:Protoporphyrinogen oxidase n=1 Tax=Aureibacter tunicatorum TaxID=866807 RepID=A0AAE3XM44_9BACT|nr:FAD-dependent oxidoreductase [Aureibacter tunicatorum]MDR6239118.1 protoporphyrinogen oxidase [Aureibacter tunicatorum]BDD04956.1 FAD-dependent oxidoreductase [Aureibacter tunicatorum]